MPATYDAIATTTLGSAATSITFSSIPGTYTDLKLVVTLIPAASTRPYMRFNSDSGSNYSRTQIYGDGSAAGTFRVANQTLAAFSGDNIAGQPGLFTADIFSYAGSTNKTLLADAAMDTNGAGSVYKVVNLWRNTNAITSIEVFTTVSNSFASGTTATLYGIKAA